MPDPYESPNATIAVSGVSKRSYWRPISVWIIGYSLQYVLFFAFSAVWRSNSRLLNSLSDDLWLMLFCLAGLVFAVIAQAAILRMHQYLTLAVRLLLLAISVLLFAQTYFLIWIFLMGMFMSRLSQI